MSKLEEARVRLAAWYRVSMLGEAAALLVDLDPDGRASPSDVRQRAHRLKGSGASFGFPDVTALAAKVEEAPEEQLNERARELVALLLHHGQAHTP